MLAIIDCGIGNLRSVLNAFNFIGQDAQIVAEPGSLASAEAIVLPGVGAFGDAMRKLTERGFREALEREVGEKKKPFLGICVGMQILASRSHEHGVHEGFGWIPGSVEKIPTPPDDPTIRVPHVGWNEVVFSRQDPLNTELGNSRDFYFVHSYRFVPDDPGVVLGSCHHGSDIASIIARDNIHAVQFHPEKSHHAGLALLRNWCERIARC